MNAVTTDRQGIHPIHRCPIDILQCIFENTLPSIPTYYNLDREQMPWWHATRLRRLCLVCRHWRDVILATPSLWSSIFIDFKESAEKLDAWWREVAQRVKSAPAVVSFQNIGLHDRSGFNFPETTDPKLRERIEERFHLCSLRAIPRIHTLRLEVTVYRYAFDVLSLMQEFPRYEMERLEIMGNKPEGGVDPKPEETWNTLLHRFPPFKSLKIAYAGPVMFAQSPSFVALVDLDIVDAPEANITTIMAACPNLRRLSIYLQYGYPTLDVSRMDPPHSTPHHLQFLRVDFVENFPWDRLGELPSLSELHFQGASQETPETVINFIGAYRSITSVSLYIPDPRLVQLAHVAPQLTSVETMSQLFNLEAFLDWKAAGMNGPAFPMLQTVKFHVIDVSSIDLQNFEAFVRKRCLPKSHPECSLEMGLHPVRQLRIRGKGKWLRSKYFASATLCEIRDRSEATLSWV
jgi:hypothetical protein